jgi:hypothetical protein
LFSDVLKVYALKVNPNLVIIISFVRCHESDSELIPLYQKIILLWLQKE